MRAGIPIAPRGSYADVAAGGRGDLVVDLCQSALTGSPCLDLASRAEAVDPEGFAALAGANRLWSACARGFSVNAVPPPAALADAIRAGRARAMMANARVIATARHVLPLLQEQGIDAVTMKGPLFYHLMHGDFLFRRSGDLDLLVPRAQFGAARAVLEKLGFLPDLANAGPWWTSSLGELHLFPRDPGHCVIDLHHRVQQPGCPAPRDVSLFLADPVSVELADVAVPTLSWANALLLACLTLAKGVVHRAPSGMHAYDVAAGFLRLDASDRAAFWQLASRQRLTNTVQFAITAAGGALGLKLPREEGGVAQPAAGARGRWFDMVFRPASQELVWPRRRELLWRMCDGRDGAAKGVTFAFEAGRVLAGEMLRRWTAGRMLQEN